MRCGVPLFRGWVGVLVKSRDVLRRKKKEACHDEADGMGEQKNGGEVEKRPGIDSFFLV